MSRSSFSFLSEIRSTVSMLRGLRYFFRLVTGKRVGFSFKGPAGLRFHFNSKGIFSGVSLKSFSGMRVRYGANGKFRGLSLPGIFKSRVYINSRGEFTGFGLPRLFGGFLIFDHKCELKRIYGPIIGGVCVSYDSKGNKKKHSVKGIKKNNFRDFEARAELPGTQRTFCRKGEATEKGVVPIPEKDIGLFNIKEPRKKRGTTFQPKTYHESGIKREAGTYNKTVTSNGTEKRTTGVTNTEIKETVSYNTYEDNNASLSEKAYSPVIKNEKPVHEEKTAPSTGKVDSLTQHMLEMDKAVGDVFSDQEEVSFEEYCAAADKAKNN